MQALKKSFNKSTSLPTPTLAPKIGEVWPGQGGVYAGIIRDDDRQWHLILAIAPESKITGEWGGYGHDIDPLFSAADGLHNTELLLASPYDHPLNRQIAALTIDGFSDYYFPARKELSLLEINLSDFMEKICHWSSTQRSDEYAWYLRLGGGYQDVINKDFNLAARAVRRLPIQ